RRILSAVERCGGYWTALAAPDDRYRFCKNWEQHGCNWMVPANAVDLFAPRAATTAPFQIFPTRQTVCVGSKSKRRSGDWSIASSIWGYLCRLSQATAVNRLSSISSPILLIIRHEQKS